MNLNPYHGRVPGRRGRGEHGVALQVIFVLSSLALAGAGQAQPGPGPMSKAVRISAREAGKAAAVRSAGATGAFFRVDAGQRGAKVELPLEPDDVALVQPESIRLFRWTDRSRRWVLVESSKYDSGRRLISASLPGPGIYTAFGVSLFEAGWELQRAFCTDRNGRLVPKICQRILCPAEGFGSSAADLAAEAPPGVSPGNVEARMGNICEQCVRGPLTPGDFPECLLPDLVTGRIASSWIPWIPWPIVILYCFEAGGGCTPGGSLVGQVDYDFEDYFNLTGYPNVDVRAKVRYPATSAGTGTPVAGAARYPLVVFLHGNHATCPSPCNCSHACLKANRVPNHLGYNYLLDVLASYGFIAVSIDGFDVTCAGSFAMSDYEARGRLGGCPGFR